MHRMAKWISAVQPFLSPGLVFDQLGSRSCECACFFAMIEIRAERRRDVMK